MRISDWSSDVCSSDLIRSLRFLLPPKPASAAEYEAKIRTGYGDLADTFLKFYPAASLDESMLATTRDAMYGWTAERLVRTPRSEERRVGKECVRKGRSGGSP